MSYAVWVSSFLHTSFGKYGFGKYGIRKYSFGKYSLAPKKNWPQKWIRIMNCERSLSVKFPPPRFPLSRIQELWKLWWHRMTKQSSTQLQSVHCNPSWWSESAFWLPGCPESLSRLYLFLSVSLHGWDHFINTLLLVLINIHLKWSFLEENNCSFPSHVQATNLGMLMYFLSSFFILHPDFWWHSIQGFHWGISKPRGWTWTHLVVFE